MTSNRKKIAVFAGAGCRACENAILDIHYQVAPLSPWADIVFWPYVLGSQFSEAEDMAEVWACFVVGAVQTPAEREMLATLRGKSRIMIACGACAAFGGLPGLADLRRNGREKEGKPAEGGDEQAALQPDLPVMLDRVYAPTDLVDVDYIVPGCPVPQNLLWAAIQSVIRGPVSRLSYAVSRLPEAAAQAVADGFPPPKGTVFAGEKAVCGTCSREKEEKKFSRFKRPFENYEATGRCLLEQGLLCQGVSTREGCGGLCTGMGLPCRGCFGKAEAVFDPGAKMVSAVSSTFDADDPEKIREITEGAIDLSGAFYRYTLPTQCALLRAQTKEIHAETDH